MEIPAKQSRLLPDKPGTYLFRDNAGRVIYVGKASSLRNRVRSYFTSKTLPPKIQMMIPKISDIDFIITDSEQEAFILENNLIKKHRPPYNVKLKDDKSYPYLKITLTEEWPRVLLTRHIKNDGSRYFGPYAGTGSLRQIMGTLNKLFPYRTCNKNITGTEDRPCLKYYIKRCAGPCINAVSRKDYQQIIRQTILFLEGKQEQIIRELKRKMVKASANLEFEKAASLRDQIQSLESITEQQKIVSEHRINEDVIAIAQDRNTACAQVFFIRGGKLLGKEHFVMEGVRGENPGKVITSFAKQFYSAGMDIPIQILLQTEPADRLLLETWLENQQQQKVKLIVPRRGKQKQLMGMVAENATEALQQLQFKWLADAGKTGAALEELKIQLHLPRIPNRIECYDISNIRGAFAVGSMAVFEEGRPRSAHYRRFKIKSVSGIDDYAMMQEVLKRRFARGIQPANKRKGESWGSVPDLVLIDGGRGHLNAVLQVMSEMQVDSIPVASIAKEKEEVFVPDIPESVILPRNSQALYLLQRIRDEAHRFAISYHTRVRVQSAFVSDLDQIPGIGPSRKRALIKQFGSIKGVKAASLEELAAVPGMTGSLAKIIKEHL